MTHRVCHSSRVSGSYKENVVFRCPPKLKGELENLAAVMEIPKSELVRLCLRVELPKLRQRYKEVSDERGN